MSLLFPFCCLIFLEYVKLLALFNSWWCHYFHLDDSPRNIRKFSLEHVSFLSPYPTEVYIHDADYVDVLYLKLSMCKWWKIIKLCVFVTSFVSFMPVTPAATVVADASIACTLRIAVDLYALVIMYRKNPLSGKQHTQPFTFRLCVMCTNIRQVQVVRRNKM